MLRQWLTFGFFHQRVRYARIDDSQVNDDHVFTMIFRPEGDALANVKFGDVQVGAYCYVYQRLE